MSELITLNISQLFDVTRRSMLQYDRTMLESQAHERLHPCDCCHIFLQVVWTLASVSEVRKFSRGEVVVKEGDCASQETLALPSALFLLGKHRHGYNSSHHHRHGRWIGSRT